MNALRRTHAATALLALTLLLAACSAGALPTQTPTPAPSDPAPTDPASPTPGATPIAVPEIVWERASVPTAQNNSSITGIVPRPGGGGYVAVGFDGFFGSIVWTSPDGLSWTEVPRPEGFDTAGISEVVPFSGGLLAVGRETADIETELAAAWISSDGTDWRRVEGGPDMQGQMLDALETDDGRLIGVGGVPGADAAGIWISADAGETWQRTGDVIENAFIWSVAPGGPGYVATGWRRNPEPTLAVWTSPDGESWTLAPDPAGGEDFCPPHGSSGQRDGRKALLTLQTSRPTGNSAAHRPIRPPHGNRLSTRHPQQPRTCPQFVNTRGTRMHANRSILWCAPTLPHHMLCFFP